MHLEVIPFTVDGMLRLSVEVELKQIEYVLVCCASSYHACHGSHVPVQDTADFGSVVIWEGKAEIVS